MFLCRLIDAGFGRFASQVPAFAEDPIRLDPKLIPGTVFELRL